MINLTQISFADLGLDEDEVASSLSDKDARTLVGAILGHHGVTVFKEVAEDIIEEFGTDA